MTGHELADPSTRRLDPTQRQRSLGQIREVGAVEIEQDLGLGEQRHPSPLVLLRTLERVSDMVRRITGSRKQVRLVHDLETWTHFADPIHVVWLEIAGDQDPNRLGRWA